MSDIWAEHDRRETEEAESFDIQQSVGAIATMGPDLVALAREAYLAGRVEADELDRRLGELAGRGYQIG